MGGRRPVAATGGHGGPFGRNRARVRLLRARRIARDDRTRPSGESAAGEKQPTGGRLLCAAGESRCRAAETYTKTAPLRPRCEEPALAGDAAADTLDCRLLSLRLGLGARGRRTGGGARGRGNANGHVVVGRRRGYQTTRRVETLGETTQGAGSIGGGQGTDGPRRTGPGRWMHAKSDHHAATQGIDPFAYGANRHVASPRDRASP